MKSHIGLLNVLIAKSEPSESKHEGDTVSNNGLSRPGHMQVAGVGSGAQLCVFLVSVNDCLRLDINNLSSFPTDSPRQLNILGHNGDTLCMYGGQVGVFKKPN